jgi:hypothetical protein
MKKRYQLSILFLLLIIQSVIGQNTSMVKTQRTPILNFQSAAPATNDSGTIVRSGFGLLDSLANDTLLNNLFKPYAGINYVYNDYSLTKVKRSLPTVKEVKERIIMHQEWKFWIILAILFYISFVRIVNPNNFRIFILSVFNLKLSEKIWEDQRSFFGFVILQLFAIYIFIASLFISNWMELKRIIFTANYLQQFFIIILILFLIYMLKFALHLFLGYLLQMRNLGIGLVSNTISVNNFIALIILPLFIFLIYNDHPQIKIILSETIIATFFLSVAYRVVRITLLSDSFFSFPRIYLFIYLCALEILPWFVIIKYLNRFQI